MRGLKIMDTPSRPSFIERLTSLLLREPEDREQLLEILHSAYERNLMDADALTIIEIIPVVIEAAHSRFPVINGDRDKVLGVLLAKDLLRIHTEKNFDLRDWLRPVVFIPESKRLNVLLREFRVSRNHMAIVVNEYGGVAGLVTIEDVLEQIVGDIEDEYDFDEAHDNIRLDTSGRFRVKARTEICDFNEAFSTTFSDEEFDTVGGLVLRHLGRVPKRNEIIDIDGTRFQVLRADSRRLYTLLVTPPAKPEAGAEDFTG
jgi:magnesium and cobalt transporter